MIRVSEAWKETHNEQLLPETFVEVEYRVSEPGLQADASLTATLEESFSEAETIVDALTKTPEKYGTLEWNSWGLDGTFEYFDGTPVDPGYTTSELSGASSLFTALPTITITFSETHTVLIPGISIKWSDVYEEWASRFRITAYRGNTQVTQLTVTDNNSVTSNVNMDLQNFDKIVIEVLEWCLPYRRARAIDIFLGLKIIYTKNDLIAFSHSQSVDLLSATLPNNEVTFSLRNDDSKWNPDNPTGNEKYLQEQQEVIVRYGMDVDDSREWIDAGRFWLSEWSTPSNGLEASFTARDSLDFMHEIYVGSKSGTLYEIALQAFRQANLPVLEDGSERFVVDSVLYNYSTDFSADDTEYTIAEVLQMVAHAGCCVLYQDRSGRVHMKQHEGTLSDYVVDQNNSYSHPEYELSKPLKSVVVSYGEDRKVTVGGAASGEVQTVDNPLITTIQDASRVGGATHDVLLGRKTLSGEFRADPRLDALDVITVRSKYADNVVTVTDVEYTTTGGAMKGTYRGRVNTQEG